ncbi:MAG: DNA translocase FtsK [Muribaculaceae bacterium]|nr:DNA translocase FtsK [Muribaculaceae bacterium]
MKRYENFSPTIPETIESGQSETLPPFRDVKGVKKEDSKSGRTKVKNRTKPEKEEVRTKKLAGIQKFVKNQTLRWIIGLFFGFFAVYLAVAFLSYFGACIADQSEINNTAVGQAGVIANAAGEGGARLSEFLINEFFGVGSFVVIIWLFVIGLRLLTGRPRLKPLNFTIKALVALITLSLIVGLLTIGLQSTVNWGGYHGRYVNEFVIHFLGWTGAVLLCIFMVCCFVLICMRDVVKWGIRMNTRRVEKKRQKEELLREQQEREREIEEMRKFEDMNAAGVPSEDDNISRKEGDDPEEMDFDNSDIGLYSKLPELDSHEYDTYNIENTDEEKNVDVSEESGKEKENSAEDTLLREKFENDTAEEQETNSEKLNSANGAEEDFQMIVNVNNISQVKGNTTKAVSESPEHYPYKFPPFDLMAPGATKISVDPEEQLENKERIKRTLLDFDIPIVSIEATVGPTVTLYEVVPDKGIRVAKIKNLVDDIALSLAAEGVRIIAPIPGKGTVGIEVANKEKQTVSMQTVLKSPDFQNTKFSLPIALGSTISNEVFVADLAKMPHLLVAGATGQGKSVGLNAIITSLLYSKRPDELKFVMVDPKRVEFSLYAKIEGHYLAKTPDAEDAIITKPEKVVDTLSSLTIEMDNRYDLLKEAGTKNIIEYNEKYNEHKLNPELGHRFLPYIVVIIDEFSDLIMTAGKEVEIPIARLAQMARAVGIHVIIATQRPAANVITGVIRANFPARMAFKVATGVDSKIILDATGAQQLIGRGDMLVSNGGPMDRVQCAYIDTKEVEKIAEHIAKQPYQQGAYLLPEPETSKGDSDGEAGSLSGERDPLFEEVARLVVQTNTASTSSIQRRYRIGYNRAGSIMDQLEAAGIVGPAQGGKPRSVLMDPVTLSLLLEN